MIPDYFRPFVQALYDNRNYRFWICQISGWGGYSLATFLSITLVDGNASWPHFGHICLSAVLGMLTTWPLRPLFRRTFGFSIGHRLMVASAALIILSAVWNILRIEIFAMIIGEPAIWSKFNYWYFGSLSVFLSWTVLYYGIKYYELLTLEHQKLLEETALKRSEHVGRLNAEASARDAQLQMLRYQLNPHFLFNTLNAINALIKLNENNKAGEMIQSLSQFLRHALDHDSVESVPLEEELDSLMLYLDIEKARFEDRLTLEFDIEPLARQALVPGLILQPIVENAMKYAIAPSEDGGTVRVAARVLEHQLHLEVTDTGPGTGAESPELGKGRGIGMRNTRERLETLYEDRFTFETSDATPSGLTVRICFPLVAATALTQERPETLTRLDQCAS